MSRTLGNVIADSLQLSLSHAERMLRGVTADQFARLARPGGATVVSNHPAFIYGHLSLYAPRILEQLGRDPSVLPQGFLDVFSKEAQCQDDPEGTIYPPMAVVTEALFQGYRSALVALQSVSDDVLQQPNPLGGRMTELFPTLSSMQAFYVGGHFMLHMGQMSAWRRMQGLGPA